MIGDREGRVERRVRSFGISSNVFYIWGIREFYRRYVKWGVR